MTIGNTLASALSGLTAAAKAAELVSSNIANATTPGYGRRELNLSARVVGASGQGVMIAGVTRAENTAVIADRRLAQAAQGDADARSAFYQKIETIIGTPDLAYSLSGRVAAFDTALTEAASHPESEARLNSVLSAAKGLVSTINTVGKEIQAARTFADGEIAAQVTQLNDGLQKVVELNVQIRRSSGRGQDPSALLDQRQQLVDKLASIVPLRQVAQEDGSVALYTTGGAVLVDGMAAEFGFTRSLTIVPEMTQDSGGLSGLTLNGRPISTEGAASMIRGGSLAAQFAVRDELGTKAQAQLDTVARDLIERFQDSGLDATRAPGDPGLFTDTGAAFDSADEVGIAQRMTLNAAIDPNRGGALWRIRDGLGALTAGEPGNSALISDLRTALTANRTPASGDFISGPRTFAVLAGDLLSEVATAKLSAQGESAYTAARLDTYEQLEAQDGVDTDQEMQNLLVIEQAYAANARVIKTVDTLINTLLDL